MKISKKDASVIAALELNTERPIATVARESGLKEHSVRYSLKTLEENNLIRELALIDLAKLGYQQVGIYFTLDQDQREAIIRLLIKEPKVVWLAEIGGDYDYGLALAFKHISELNLFFEQISNKTSGAFLDKSIVIQLAYRKFNRTFLSSSTKIDREELTLGISQDCYDVDSLDLRILKALVTERPKSRRMLAKLIGEPLSTVDLRVKKLNDQKIILANTYEINTNQLGLLNFSLHIYCKGIDGQFTKSLIEFCRSNPNIFEIYSCLGSWDFEINLNVFQASDAKQIMNQITKTFAKQIQSVKMYNRFRDLKKNLIPW